MRSSTPKRSPLALRARSIQTWCIRLGVILPVIYYLSRRYFYFSIPWELPAHSLVRQLVVAALALGFYTVWSRRVAIAKPPARPPQSRWPAGVLPPVAGPIFAALIAALFLSFLYYEFKDIEGRHFLTGDEGIWLEHLREPHIMVSEPLGRWSHHVTWRLLRLLGDFPDMAPLRVSSIAAGAFYLAVCMALSPGIFPRWPRAAAIFVWAAPSSLVFMGYPETTPWAWALSGTYLLLGVDHLNRRPSRAPWLASFALMLAVATHGVVCFMTAAQCVLIAVWWRDARANGTPPVKRIATSLVLAVMPFALLGALFLSTRAGLLDTGAMGEFGNAGGGGDGRRWVLITGEPAGNLVRLFSPAHLTSLINLILAGNAFVLIAPFAIRDLFRRAAPAAAFLSLALAGMIFFAIAWNADWGMLRDFDLFVGFALPTQLIVALWWNTRLSRRARLRLAAAVFLSTAVWLILPFARHFGPFLRYDDPFLAHVLYFVLGSTR